jgi:transcription initiation factor IIE alpha subunit
VLGLQQHELEEERKMDQATLKMAMAAMSDSKSVAADVAKRLNMTTTTLYSYVNGDGTPKELGRKIIQSYKINFLSLV